MNENKQIKRTSKSKALVKKGRAQALADAEEDKRDREADDRDREERARIRRARQGSNYDPTEDDLEDSYTPEGEETLSENEEMSPEVQRAGRKITKWLEGRRKQGPARALARKLTIGDQGTFLYGRDKVRINPPPRNPVNSSYEPEGGESVEHLDELIMPKRGKSGAYKSGKIRKAVLAGSERIAKKYRSNVLASHADEMADRADERREKARGPVRRFVDDLEDKMRERSERRRTGRIGAGPRTRNPVNSSYEPEGETTLSEFDSSTTEFADRVINRVYEGFDKMTAGELEDYDNNANKPKHGRKASQQERKKMAAKFQNSRGGASTKTKQGRDLRLRKAK